MENQIKTWAQSSQDPTQIANTIKGFVLMGSGIIIYLFATFFHITLTGDDVVNLATDFGTLAGALWAVWGIGMKIVSWFVIVKTPITTA